MKRIIGISLILLAIACNNTFQLEDLTVKQQQDSCGRMLIWSNCYKRTIDSAVCEMFLNDSGKCYLHLDRDTIKYTICYGE